MDSELKNLDTYLSEELADHIVERQIENGELTIVVRSQSIVRVLMFLRDDVNCYFRVLMDICGVDHLREEERFDVVYHLLSLTQNRRIRVKLRTDEDTFIPTVSDIFSAANWFEREVYDLFGIYFSGHPDMRRILCDYGFDGHPLRKDFPLSGHVEVRYDEERQRVVYEPVKLVQEFRNFDFLSPWEGNRSFLPGDEKAKNG